MPAPTMLELCRLGQSFHAALHLLERYVFDMGGDSPDMTERINEVAGTVAVNLVLHGTTLAGAERECASKNIVNVCNVNHQANGTSAESFGTAIWAGLHFVGKHNYGVANAKFGVA